MIEQFETSGSHREVGFAIGQRFAQQIHRSLDAYRFLQERILPYHRTPEGQARYRQLLELHQIRYPDYFADMYTSIRSGSSPTKHLHGQSRTRSYGLCRVSHVEEQHAGVPNLFGCVAPPRTRCNLRCLGLP